MLQQAILQYNPSLTAAEIEMMCSRLVRCEHGMHHQLLIKGQVCKHLYFLEKGLVRCHTFEEDRTLWGEFEQNFFTSMTSFVRQVPSRECLTFIEPSIVYAITYKDLMHLYAQSHAWANWGRKLAEYLYLMIEEMYQSLLYKDASERYEELLRMRPDIVQRVPLHHLASFLGISTVSLSRIRAGTQKSRN